MVYFLLSTTAVKHIKSGQVAREKEKPRQEQFSSASNFMIILLQTLLRLLWSFEHKVRQL
jgi:hypothetical protein